MECSLEYDHCSNNCGVRTQDSMLRKLKTNIPNIIKQIPPGFEAGNPYVSKYVASDVLS
jgi:hypothetical protein